LPTGSSKRDALFIGLVPNPSIWEQLTDQYELGELKKLLLESKAQIQVTIFEEAPVASDLQGSKTVYLAPSFDNKSDLHDFIQNLKPNYIILDRRSYSTYNDLINLLISMSAQCHLIMPESLELEFNTYGFFNYYLTIRIFNSFLTQISTELLFCRTCAEVRYVQRRRIQQVEKFLVKLYMIKSIMYRQ